MLALDPPGVGCSFGRFSMPHTSPRSGRLPDSAIRGVPALRVPSLALVLSVLVAGCDGGPSAPQISSVRVEASASAVVLGESLQLEAVPLNPRGEPISGLNATWSSTAPQVLEVDAQGRVTGRALGSATIQATVNGVAGGRSIQVIPVPVASIEVTPPQVELIRGEEAQLAVTLRSAGGGVLEDRVVLFQSSDPQVVGVTSGGRVSGNRVGSALVTLTSGQAQASVPVSVFPADEPVIEGISSGTLQEGMTLEIFGIRFSPNRLLNEVRLGSEEVEVLEASPERLLVQIPSFICHPTGPMAITVSVGGDVSPPFVAPFQASSTLSLAPGEFLRLPSSARPCLRFAATGEAGRYLVGVQSTSGTPALLTPVEVRSILPATPAAALYAAALLTPEEAPRPAELLPTGTSFETAVARQAREGDVRTRLHETHRRAEASLRAREAALLESSPTLEQTARQRLARVTRSGAPGAGAALTGAAATGATFPTAAQISASAQVGDTVSVRVPDILANSFCTGFIPIRAVVRRNGSGSIWLEDVANPVPGLGGADYATLGGQFDDLTLPAISNQFGAPTDVDGNGRIVIVVTREVNRFGGGLLGFVVSTDFFPSTGNQPGQDHCPSSNQGEFYYSIAPAAEGTIPSSSGRSPSTLSLEDFRSLTPRLAAHEATHIIQFGRRLLETPLPRQLASVWELEGQAVVAQEVAAYATLGLGPRQNLGPEVGFGAPAGQPTPTEWLRDGFTELALFYGFQSSTTRAAGAPGRCGWLDRDVNGPCIGGRLPYGVSWSFHRWVLDHYGNRFTGGEAELMRRLVMAQVPGFPAFEQVLGEPVAPLLARWAAALYTDGRLPPGSDPLLSFPSWDLRALDDILFETARLVPIQRSFANVNVAQPVAAGSTVYLRVEGEPQPAAALRATGANGGALPGHMQVWVVRLP